MFVRQITRELYFVSYDIDLLIFLKMFAFFSEFSVFFENNTMLLIQESNFQR